jgi:tetraacyldisaccharide 4'-kinase
VELSPAERGFWYLLVPFGILYGLLAQLRHLLFDVGVLSSRHAGVPTVSVGNLTVGGTGKTPFVESMSRSLDRQGISVGILSRGYGGTGEDEDDEVLSSVGNREHIRRWVHPNRLRAAEEALKSTSPDLFVMDDGFQHRQMERDLDIVLVDGLKGFGNGYPLPAGPLREPVSQIQRADLVVITRSNRLSERERDELRHELQQHLKSDVPVLHAVHHPVRIVDHSTGQEVDLQELRDQRLLAFCGIGTPASFEHTLQDDLDLDPVDVVTYPDHHDYSETDREELRDRAGEEGVDALITTHKDAVKWPESTSIRLLYVEVEVRVTEGKDLLERELKKVMAS